MPHCIHTECNNSSGKLTEVSFHNFPKRLEFREKWLQAIDKTEAELPKYAQLCSEHFEPSCFDRSCNLQRQLMGEKKKKKRSLMKDAVPTLFDEPNRPAKQRREVDERLREVNEVLSTRNTCDMAPQWPADLSKDIVLDHSYCCSKVIIKDAVMYDRNCESSESCLTNEDEVKQDHHACNSLYTSEADMCIDNSQGSVYSREHNEGSEFCPSSQDSQDTIPSSSQSEQKKTIHSQKTFLVFEENLKELLKFCPKCGATVLPESTTELPNEGSQFTVNIECLNGCSYRWQSQPEVSHTRGAGNVLLSTAITLSGITFEKFQQFSDLINLQTVKKDAHYNIKMNYVLPEIHEAWNDEQNKVVQEIKERGDPVMLAGDGRADSPGHSAKYGTYTMMDTESEKIVDFEVVEVTEVKNSNAMEKEGLIRTMNRIDNDLGVNVKGLSTDGHTGIKKHMREQEPEKDHEIDPWHISKNVGKKVTAASKKKNCAELSEWTQSIKNHFWWSVATCEGNPGALVERWTSLIHHVVNRHQWPGAHSFKRCEHGPLQCELTHKKRWLKAGSPAHKQLVSIVKDKRLLNNLRQCTKGVSTTMLEVYHSLYLKYLPKKQHFTFPMMVAGTELAALDHNNNVGRNQVARGDGKDRFKVAWSKVTKNFTAKPVLERKQYNYLKDILCKVVMRVETGCKGSVARSQRNMAPGERPNRDSIIAAKERFSRFRN